MSKSLIQLFKEELSSSGSLKIDVWYQVDAIIKTAKDKLTEEELEILGLDK